MKKNLFYITAADFIVRAAYQMGKTPLLPLFAASLGAGGAFLGFIVAVSTFTGMGLKPLVGVLSDRWGRRVWLWGGTALFAGMPFLYRFVESSEELLALRLVHGLATAIYGPVTLAFVAETAGADRAAKLGWFGLGRGGGYIVGPAAAGWLLTVLEPVAVFTVIGLLSCLAFAPLALLGGPVVRRRPMSVGRQLGLAFKSGATTAAVWLAGGLDAVVFVALYAVKAFLPIYALAQGLGPGIVGTYFSLQEIVHLAARPLGGRLGDRLGYRVAIALGMALLAVGLALLSWGWGPVLLLALAPVLGLAQGFIFPSTIALVADRIEHRHLGAGMGMVGTLKNAGKVAGPVCGGLLVEWLDYAGMFRVLAALLVVAALGLWFCRPRTDAKVAASRAAAQSEQGVLG